MWDNEILRFPPEIAQSEEKIKENMQPGFPGFN